MRKPHSGEAVRVRPGRKNGYGNGRMDRRQDRSGIGERVLSAVQEAVESGNFGELSEIVKDTAGAALEEFRYQTGQIQEQLHSMREAQGQSGRPRSERQREKEIRRLTKQYINKKGKAAGIVLTVFGGTGVGAFGFVAALFLLSILISPGTAVAAAMIFFSVAALGSAGLLWAGCRMQARLKRAERYVRLMWGERYVELKDLAARTGQELRIVQKDLRGMLKAEIFPRGHMDECEYMFVLDDETWEQYLAARSQWRESSVTASSGPEPQELAEEVRMEQEGRAYVDRLRGLNAQITGEAISNRLYRLDSVLRRIFAVLQEHPEKCPQMQKFMDYYLPTTLKLVESYADFDRAGVRGEQVQSARAEIEKTLDSINEAFEKLLEDLYQEAAFEASADAKVLKTVLAQDGYTQNGFPAQSEKKG